MTSLFSCCFRRKKKRSEVNSVIPDEESGLLAGLDDARQHIVDYRALEDRLGEIVRAKESKMVNVSSRIPFNLYNQPLDLSTSRSVSLSRQLGTRAASGSAERGEDFVYDGGPKQALQVRIVTLDTPDTGRGGDSRRGRAKTRAVDVMSPVVAEQTDTMDRGDAASSLVLSWGD